MAISQQFLDELIARTDIVDLVGQYVQLTRKGSNYFGLCPFHNEKTGSFSVNPERQIYHCFGCGAGGGAVRFVMEIEGLPFQDAVAFLAKRAGMEMEEDQQEDKRIRRQRERMIDMHKKAARFFYQQFVSEDGKTAQIYAKKRGLTSDTIKKFGIGYAPESWDKLLKTLSKEGYSYEEIESAGLAVKGKNGSYYDRFRKRLMFPIINIRNEVIAFGGRIIGDGEPKYLNSPDTLIFSKSRNLFCLNYAKNSKRNNLILTEGNMDAISLHQAGFDNAVASCGTSLTEEQAKLISRFKQEIVIAYDSDNAGRKAVLRAIPILESVDLKVKVLNYSGSKDPDEYIQKNGHDAFEMLLQGSDNQIIFQISAIKKKYNVEDDAQKIAYIQDLANFLCTLKPVEREVYGGKEARVIGISEESMNAAIKEAYRKRAKKIKNKMSREETSPVVQFQPKTREIRYNDPVSARAEEEILILLVTDNVLFDQIEGKLKEEDFSSDFLGKVFKEFQRQYKDGKAVSPAMLEMVLTEEEMSRLTMILQRPRASSGDGIGQIQKCIDIVHRQKTLSQAKDDNDALLELQKKMMKTKSSDNNWR